MKKVYDIWEPKDGFVKNRRYDTSFGEAMTQWHDYIVMGAYTWKQRAPSKFMGRVQFYKVTTNPTFDIKLSGQLLPSKHTADKGVGFFGRSVHIHGDYLLVSGFANGIAKIYKYELFDSGNDVVAHDVEAIPIRSGRSHRGYSYVSFGDAVLVGDSSASVDNARGAGVVMALNMNPAHGRIGELISTISNPTPSGADLFGRGLGLDESHLFVCAKLDDTMGRDTGAVYLYDLSAGIQSPKLLHTFVHPYPASGARDNFASQVALTPDVLAISAPDEGAEYAKQGIVHLYDRRVGEQGFGAHLGELKSVFAAPHGDSFGAKLASHGHLLIVTQRFGNSREDRGGAISVYDANPSSSTFLGLFFEHPLTRDMDKVDGYPPINNILVTDDYFYVPLKRPEPTKDRKYAGNFVRVFDTPSFFPMTAIATAASNEKPGDATHPLGADDFISAATTTFEVKPEGKFTTYIWGPEGARFQIKLELVPNTGGHLHHPKTKDRRAVGRMTPSSGVLKGEYPQNLETIFTATNFCGLIKKTVTFTSGGKFVRYYRVRFKGLKPLPSHKFIETYTNTKNHPENMYGRPSLVRAIVKCAEAFGKKFPKSKLWVNDMSLPWGGLFDYKDNLQAPHAGHKWGGEVDISYQRMSRDERIWFGKNARKHFKTVRPHGNPKHWHCSIWRLGRRIEGVDRDDYC